MAREFTRFENLPLELGEKIFEDAVAPPGIHFYRYIGNKDMTWRNESGWDPSGWIVPGHFSHTKPFHCKFGIFRPGNCTLGECYCHGRFVVCNEPSRRHPTGDFIQNSASFSARNRPTEDASSYITADILAETSQMAKDVVARCFDNEAVYQMHGEKKLAKICTQWFQFESKLLRRDKDLFCLQLGFDPFVFGFYLDPIDPMLDVSDCQDLVGLKKLAFEWRPWLFMFQKTLRWTASFTMPGTTGSVEYYSIGCKRKCDESRREKELWRVMPDLDTLYFIDYSISLKEGHQPDSTSDVFVGHKHRFVEVKPDDNAFAFDETRVVSFEHEVRHMYQENEIEIIEGEQPTSLELARWLQESSRIDKARSEKINCAPAGNSPVGCTRMLDSNGNALDLEWKTVEPWTTLPAGDGLEEKLDYPYPFKVKVLACIKD